MGIVHLSSDELSALLDGELAPTAELLRGPFDHARRDIASQHTDSPGGKVNRVDPRAAVQLQNAVAARLERPLQRAPDNAPPCLTGKRIAEILRSVALCLSFRRPYAIWPPRNL